MQQTPAASDAARRVVARIDYRRRLQTPREAARESLWLVAAVGPPLLGFWVFRSMWESASFLMFVVTMSWLFGVLGIGVLVDRRRRRRAAAHPLPRGRWEQLYYCETCDGYFTFIPAAMMAPRSRAASP